MKITSNFVNIFEEAKIILHDKAAACVIMDIFMCKIKDAYARKYSNIKQIWEN